MSKQISRKKSPQFNNKKGFSFLEVIIAIFIFSLVMLTTTSIFSRFVVYQKRAKVVQQNTEDARFAMELMAKTLRTSNVEACINSSGNEVACNSSAVAGFKIYDYSQDKCIVYRFNSGKIKTSKKDPTPPGGNNCSSFDPANTDMVGNSINNMAFSVIQSSSTATGKVTFSMKICSTSGCSGTGNDQAVLQTTVSLRDYSEVNP